VLVAGATGDVADGTPRALACEGLGVPSETPSGIRVYPADALPDELDVDRVLLVPSEPQTVHTIETWAAARGVVVERAVPAPIAVPDEIRVVAVSSPSTGSGKTALVRRLTRALRASGVRVAVVRHPIANLLAWDRFAATLVRSPDELGGGRPLEEREELAPIVGAGIPVATGLDPDGLVRAAARSLDEKGVIVWDGGGAALPWLRTDLHLVVLDLIRPPADDVADRVGGADAVILTKADSAEPDAARAIEADVHRWNAQAPVVLADFAVGVSSGLELADRRVVCVEDWSSLALGGLSAGVAAVAARRFRCGVVDPRPFVTGTVRAVLEEHQHIGPVIPSLGRTPAEIGDLAASVRSTPGDVVLWGSNADPRGVIPDETRPIIRAYGELTEVAGPSLQELLTRVLPGHG
jgi:predicted GTPase